jgi:cytoskeletal protein CcmA (bactofilin family)
MGGVHEVANVIRDWATQSLCRHPGNDPAVQAEKEAERKEYADMWKPNQPEHSDAGPVQEQSQAVSSPSDSEPAIRAGNAKTDQAVIGKSLYFKGEITGAEPLFIDGKVEGSINLPGNRVTVGRNGQVGANISAREIIVMGKIRGNITASDRVDIRAEGALTGDVAAARISIEDGAFFKGGIDIRKSEAKETKVPMALSAVTLPDPPRPIQPA